MRKFLVNQDFVLTISQRRALVQIHKAQRDKRIADRIKAIIMLSDGLSPIQIEQYLLMNERHVRRCRDVFLEHGAGGLLETHFRGSDSKLDEDQLRELEKHLQDNLYQTANEIRNFVYKQFRVRYTTKGIVPLLHRLGFVYKKAKGVPGRCVKDEQKRFARKYRRMRKFLGKNDRIYFADAAVKEYFSLIHCIFDSAVRFNWGGLISTLIQ